MANEKITNKDERVEVFVPKGLANDDPNLYISINGENFLLPKGLAKEVNNQVMNEFKNAENSKKYKTEQDIAAAIADCGFDERIRGEALSLQQFALLSDVLAKYLKV